MPRHKIYTAMGFVLDGFVVLCFCSLRDFDLSLRLEVGRHIEEELNLVRVKIGEVDVQRSLLMVMGVTTSVAVKRILTLLLVWRIPTVGLAMLRVSRSGRLFAEYLLDVPFLFPVGVSMCGPGSLPCGPGGSH